MRREILNLTLELVCLHVAPIFLKIRSKRDDHFLVSKAAR